MDDVITTAEACELLGVGPTALKRWTDEGRLPCLRTAGGHRRFRRADVERFLVGAAGERAAAAAVADDAERLVELMLARTSVTELAGHLLALRARAGAWHRAAAVIGRALHKLGERWADGRCSVMAEHLASERLARALARVSEEVPVRLDAPRALLATAGGDDHTLGLSLVEVCLREAGWVTTWAGRATPAAELVATVRAGHAEMVVLSASCASGDRRALGRLATRVGAACADAGVPLLVGGQGAWPDAPRHAQLVRDFSTLNGLAVAMGAAARRRAS